MWLDYRKSSICVAIKKLAPAICQRFFQISPIVRWRCLLEPFQEVFKRFERLYQFLLRIQWESVKLLPRFFPRIGWVSICIYEAVPLELIWIFEKKKKSNATSGRRKKWLEISPGTLQKPCQLFVKELHRNQSNIKIFDSYRALKKLPTTESKRCQLLKIINA